MKPKPFHFWVLVDKVFGDVEAMVSPWDMQMKPRLRAYYTRREARLSAKHNPGMFRVTKVEIG